MAEDTKPQENQPDNDNAKPAGESEQPQESVAQTSQDAGEATSSEKVEVGGSEVIENVKDNAEPTVGEAEKKKRGFLGRLRRRKSKPEKNTSEEKPVSQEEATEAIYKRIAEVRSKEFITVSIRKRTLLTLGGLVIIGMWVVALWQVWQQKQLNGAIGAGEVVREATEQQKEQRPEVLRVRVAPEQAESGAEIVALLKNEGFGQVELVEDAELVLEGMVIVVREQDAALKVDLETILDGQYHLASASTVLDPESDFDAVIFYSQ